jgi:hypothetical protein
MDILLCSAGEKLHGPLGAKNYESLPSPHTDSCSFFQVQVASEIDFLDQQAMSFASKQHLLREQHHALVGVST